MSPGVYTVQRDGDGWSVASADLQLGPFLNRPSAIRAAIEAAHRAGCNGIPAKVLVRTDNGQLYPAWIHGRDALSFWDQDI